jgi:hypothetical protein
LAKAAAAYSEALATRQKIGKKENAAHTQLALALAELYLEQGQAGQTETVGREALQVFETEQANDDEMTARAMLAQSLLAQRRQKEIDVAQPLLSKTQIREARLKIVITSGLVDEAAGDSAQARKQLSGALAEGTEVQVPNLRFASSSRVTMPMS